jgi:hypothetical protein
LLPPLLLLLLPPLLVVVKLGPGGGPADLINWLFDVAISLHRRGQRRHGSDVSKGPVLRRRPGSVPDA